MRAVCDSCAGAQPPDWKSGDLCTNCGLIARREQRCHWCAGWTPEGKFCRGCGAQTVDDESYPAARMLKHAGVDQFSIIERLTSLEPDHREHLTRMYQRQAALVARHVDDLAFVETYLRHTGRAQVLDDELTNTLPVSDERMAELKLAASVVGSDGHRLREISGSTPFGSTAELAVVAMVRLSVADTDLLDADSLEVARLALHSNNPDTVDEAVAAFGHWSVVLRTSPLIRKYELLEILEDHPSLEASIAVCLLQGNREIDRGLLASRDPDIAFAAEAISLHEVDG